MKRNTHCTQRATADVDFNTPTPLRLRRKMVKWQEIIFRLMSEFPNAGVGVATRINPPNRRSLLDSPLGRIIVYSEFEGTVRRRASELYKLAYYRNADIKFGFRRGKGRWWQTSAA